MIKTTKDGRTILTGRDYTRFRERLFALQAGMCDECRGYVSLLRELEDDHSFHVHHLNGRGMGGGKRDDTLEACIGLCGKCHREKHQPRRILGRSVVQ